MLFLFEWNLQVKVQVEMVFVFDWGVKNGLNCSSMHGFATITEFIEFYEHIVIASTI